MSGRLVYKLSVAEGVLQPVEESKSKFLKDLPPERRAAVYAGIRARKKAEKAQAKEQAVLDERSRKLRHEKKQARVERNAVIRGQKSMAMRTFKELAASYAHFQKEGPLWSVGKPPIVVTENDLHLLPFKERREAQVMLSKMSRKVTDLPVV